MSVSPAPPSTYPIVTDGSSGFAAAQVILRARKSQPFFARHPWVFDTAVDQVIGSPADGDVVDLMSDKNRFIARGVINSRSRLRVRLYSWNPAQPLDASFWQSRLSQAVQLRRELNLVAPSRGARLVFSEADELSGLVVDRYGDYLVVQLNSLAMTVRRQLVVNTLIELLHPKGIVLRKEKGIAKEEGIDPSQEVAHGALPLGPVFIEENGIRFGVDVATGQKTGGYLDQSENRVAAARFLQGRRTLDMFCYTGGFSLAAAKLGRAREVIGIDSSELAIKTARANAELNGIPNVQFRKEDCFDALFELTSQGERFGGVILDPPKFTRSRHNLDEALRAYHQINRLAVELLEPGGILVTCSCSGSVSRNDFANMLSVVSQKSKRNIQVLEQRGASVDHPISICCPESEYLKCFICRVG